MSYIFLASPYSHPDVFVRKQRHLETEAAVRWMLSHKIWTFSPIVHNHFLAEGYELPRGIDFWFPYSRAMIRHAAALWVLQIPGYGQSKGVGIEIGIAQEYRIPLGRIRPNADSYTHSLLPEGLNPEPPK